MKRDTFGSKIGLLAAAAGSAIGLGNIWKFPYITGENGGAAFILVYLLCIAVIGLPLMITEFALGRKTQSNVVETFRKLEPNKPWYITGILSVVTPFIILSFYSMIAGWVFAYIGKSATGKLISVAPSEIESYFGSVAGNGTLAVFCSFIVLALTAFIVISGVQKGVEKYSKILMPILLVLLVVLMARSLTLEGASKGVEFLFKPDFSSLKPSGVLEALGHSFYSLSLAMGIIMTYGSYVDKKANIAKLAFNVTIADTAIALMAGLVIFPAVFAYGLAPESGPNLIFITLPTVFEAMPFGVLFETLFFILIGVAAITSTISLLEVSVTFITEKLNVNRRMATIVIALLIFLLSIPSTLSFSVLSDFKIFGMTCFGIFDFLTSNIFLPLTGLLICIFTGWVWGPENALKEITNEGTIPFAMGKVYGFIIKFIAPFAILLIFLNTMGWIKF